MEQPTQQPTPNVQEPSPVFLAVISYISVLCLFPYFTKTKDAAVQFHMKQGMALFAVEIVAVILHVTIIFAWVGALLNIACLVGSIYGMYNAYNNKQTEIPGLAPIIGMMKF